MKPCVNCKGEIHNHTPLGICMQWGCECTRFREVEEPPQAEELDAEKFARVLRGEKPPLMRISNEELQKMMRSDWVNDYICGRYNDNSMAVIGFAAVGIVAFLMGLALGVWL